MVTANAANTPPTPAQLLAELAAAESEIAGLRDRLAVMDGANGRFLVAQAAADVLAALPPDEPGVRAPAHDPKVPKVDFIDEMAVRLANIVARIETTEETVAAMKTNGVLATGYPNGRSKSSD